MVKGQNLKCDRAPFPIIVGSQAQMTAARSFDYNAQTDSIAVVGSTMDNVLRNDAITGQQSCLITFYSGPQKLYMWGKSITQTSIQATQLEGVTINSNGQNILTHSNNYNALLIFSTTDGNLINARFYGQANDAYNYDWQIVGILLSGDTIPRAIVTSRDCASANTGCTGFHVFGFEISPLSATPTWSQHSHSLTNRDRPYGLAFAETEAKFYLYSIQSNNLHVQRVNSQSGLVIWLRYLDITALGPPIQMGLELYTSQTNAGLKQLFVIAGWSQASTTWIISFSLTGDGEQCQGNSIYTDDNQRDLVYRGMYAVTENVLRILFTGTQGAHLGQTILAFYYFLNTVIQYKYILPRLIEFTSFIDTSLAKFISEEHFLIMSNGFDFYYSGETISAKLSNYQQSVIYSSEQSESCYTRSANPEFNGKTTLVIYTFLDNTPKTVIPFSASVLTFTEIKIKTTDIINLVPQHFTSIDSQCFSSSHQTDLFENISGPLTLIVINLNSGVKQQYSFVQSKCETQFGEIITPTFTFSGKNVDGTALPAYISVDSTSGVISTSVNSLKGEYSIILEGTLQNNIKKSYEYLTIIIANSPPIFENDLSNQYLYLNSKVIYPLPAIFDGNNDAISVQTYEEGSTSLPLSLISFDQNYKEYVIDATQFSDIGNHKIIVGLSDGQNDEQFFSFNVEVKNTAPIFKEQTTLQNQVVLVGIIKKYKLPEMFDNENHDITILVTEKDKFIQPFFVQLTDSTLTFQTSTEDEIGSYEIKVTLSDTNMETSYYFKIDVQFQFSSKSVIGSKIAGLLNPNPPGFEEQLQDQFIMENEVVKYKLPTIYDQEGDLFLVTVQLADATPFTIFKGDIFKFFPKKGKAKDTPYKIIIILNDINKSSKKLIYYLKVTVSVETNNKISQDQKVNVQNVSIDGSQSIDKTFDQFGKIKDLASFIIKYIKQDGILSLKFRANALLSSLINEINQETFNISLLTQNNKLVLFEIKSKDQETGVIDIKLKFEDYKQISSSLDLDVLEIEVMDDIIVEDDKFQILLNRKLRLSTQIPVQISEGAQSLAESIQSGAYFASITIGSSAVIINVFLSIFMNLLWTLLNDLSFLMILSMISISVPGIASQIQQAVLNFIFMDIFQTDRWLSKVLFNEEEYEEDAINFFFEMNNYPTKNLIRNLGSTFVFLLLYLATHILHLVLIMISNFTQRFDKLKLKLYNILIWDGSIRFLIQQYTPLLLASYMNLYGVTYQKLMTLQLKNSSISELLGSILSFLIIFSSQLSICFMIVIIRKSRNKLKTQQFKKSYSNLTEGLSLKGFFGKYWHIITLIRWSATIAILVSLCDHYVVQIFILLIISAIIQVCLCMGHPYALKIDNRICIFNEIMISCYLYMMIILITMDSQILRERLGWGLLSTIFLTLLVNLSKTVYLIYSATVQYIQLRKIKQNKVKKIKGQQKDIISSFKQIRKVVQTSKNQKIKKQFSPKLNESTIDQIPPNKLKKTKEILPKYKKSGFYKQKEAKKIPQTEETKRFKPNEKRTSNHEKLVQMKIHLNQSRNVAHEENPFAGIMNSLSNQERRQTENTNRETSLNSKRRELVQL